MGMDMDMAMDIITTIKDSSASTDGDSITPTT
jgi:hypothetical protein